MTKFTLPKPKTIFDIKNVMFCANDTEEHDLCWSPIAKRWMIESRKHGLIELYDSFTLAVHTMEILTTTTGAEWTIHRHPYH